MYYYVLHVVEYEKDHTASVAWIMSISTHLLIFFLYRNILGSHRISGFMYNRIKLKYTDERKQKHKEPAQLNSCSAKYSNAKPEETVKGKE